MKKLMILVLAIGMLATSAYAEGETETTGSTIGARAGYSISPDQFFFGAHMDLGQLAGPMRIVPNVEIGFGDNLTLICINGDLVYDFADTPWSVGGELGIIYSSWDDGGLSDIPGFESYDSSSTDIGLSVLGDYRLVMSNGKTLLLEGKLGLTNSPDFKFTVGYNFF